MPASPEEVNLLTELVGARVKADALKSVEQRLAQERDELERRRVRAFEIAKWAGGSIVFLLGVIGWTQWQGIRETVERSFDKRLEATYLISDASSPTRRSLDRHVGEALIAGKLLRTLALEQTHNGQAELLSSEERERIKTIVGTETTDAFIFEAGLFVLARQRTTSDEVRRKDEQFFGELVAATRESPKYAWLADRDDRKQLVLFHSGTDYVVGRAVPLLKPGVSTALAESVLDALANGSGRSDGIPVDALKTYCASSELAPDMRRACYLARLSLSPGDAALAKEFIEDKPPPASSRRPELDFERAVHAWRVLDQLLARIFHEASGAERVGRIWWPFGELGGAGAAD